MTTEYSGVFYFIFFFLIFQKRILSNWKYSDTERIIVSCPSKQRQVFTVQLQVVEWREGRKHDLTPFSSSAGQCACQEVLVNGSSCSSITGYYSKLPLQQNTQNTTFTQPSEKKKKRSQCLLTQLAKCLISNNQNSKIKRGCENYTEPLMGNVTRPKSDPENYGMYNFRMTKVEKHDFWLIGELCATAYVEWLSIRGAWDVEFQR